MTPSHAESGGASALPSRPDGLRIRPFRAVRYTDAAHPDLSAVIAPPYDVIDESEHRALEAADAHNVVRLILPREPAGSGDRYLAAAKLYREWLDDGVLAFDDRPSLYLYRQRRDGIVLQAGLFAAVGLEPLDSGVILPHELVRPGPVEDRLSLMRAMRANPEPILLLYNGGGRASAVSTDVMSSPPIRSTVTSDRITHELWVLDDPQLLKEIQDDLSTAVAMIADGHHRYTTYGYLRSELAGRADSSGSSGSNDSGDSGDSGDQGYSGGWESQGDAAPWDYGLALIVDLSIADPDVRAIHRVVPGLSLEDAVARASAGFGRVERLDHTDADSLLAVLAGTAGYAFAVTDGRAAVLLASPDPELLQAAKPADRSTAWWALDASVAGAYLLASLWQIEDVEGQLEAEHDPAAAIVLALQLDGVAVLLKPPALADIVAVALAGDTMPRKSTLFGPKPRSGLVLRSLDG